MVCSTARMCMVTCTGQCHRNPLMAVEMLVPVRLSMSVPYGIDLEVWSLDHGSPFSVRSDYRCHPSSVCCPRVGGACLIGRCSPSTITGEATISRGPAEG